MTLELPLPYPDAELVVMDILRPLAPVVTWLPDNPPDDLIWVMRIGGGPDPWDVTDYPLIRVGFYGATRTAAWALAGQGESLILAHRHRAVDAPGKPAHGILIDFAEIDVGGSLDPDLDPDERRVIKNFVLGMRRQEMAVVSP